MWHLAASPIARNAGSAAVALAWVLLSATFILLLSSLGRVDGVPGFRHRSRRSGIDVRMAADRWSPDRDHRSSRRHVARYPRWHGGVAWPEALVVAFVAGYSARPGVHASSRRAREVVEHIVAAAIAIIATSLAMHFLFEHATSGGAELRSTVWRLLSRDYFVDTSQLQSTPPCA